MGKADRKMEKEADRKDASVVKEIYGIDYTKIAKTGVITKVKFYFCRIMQKSGCQYRFYRDRCGKLVLPECKRRMLFPAHGV